MMDSVAESMQTQLLRQDAEVDCPSCTYPLWIRLSEVVVQTAVRCPCCRVRIHLVDDRGSAAGMGAEIDSMIEGLFDGWS